MTINIKSIGAVLLIVVYYFAVRFGVSAYVVNGQLQNQAVNHVASKVENEGVETTTEVTSSMPESNSQEIKSESTAQTTTEVVSMNDQVIRGSGEGYMGEMVVDVTLVGNQITAISIVQTEDDDDWVDDVKRQLIPAIIDAQSTNVDVVSGATFSSKGVISAVNDALSKR